jgi:hypothetical protein
VLAVAVLSWVPRFTTPIDLRYDGSVYYILGTALAEGQGYRLLNEPGNIEATQYPPLLPLIVAAHQRILGTSDPIVVGRWLRLTFFVVYLVSSCSIYLLLKRHLPLHYAFLATLICLLSMYNYLMSNMLVPEVLFGLTTTLFFLCRQQNEPRRYFGASYALAVASYGLRTIGVALLAAWVAEALPEKRCKQMLLRLALSLLPVFCWQGFIHHVEAGFDYKHPAYEYQRSDSLFYNVSYARNVLMKDSFHPESGRATVADVSYRFLANLKAIPLHIGEVISVEKKVWWAPFIGNYPRTSGLALDFVLTALGCLVIGGVALQLAEQRRVVPIYVLFTIAAICFTPWPVQVVRYLTPLCPFLAWALFTSLSHFSKLAAPVLPKAVRPAAFVVAPVVALILLQQSLVYYQAHTRWIDEVVYDVRGGAKARHLAFGYFESERNLNAGLAECSTAAPNNSSTLCR